MLPACCKCCKTFPSREPYIDHLLLQQECREAPSRSFGFTDMPTLERVKGSVRDSQHGEERWRRMFRELNPDWIANDPSPCKHSLFLDS